MEQRTFRHPGNGHEETIDRDPVIGVLFFGGIYLLLKGLWVHCVFWWIAVSTGILLNINFGSFVVAPLLSIVYAFTIRDILAKRYLRQGWIATTPSERTPYLSETPAKRSEERRVGNEGVSKCRSRWSPYN